MLGLLCRTWAVSGLNCPLACGILVLQPEIEHLSLSLAGGFLTTEPLGKPPNLIFFNLFIFNWRIIALYQHKSTYESMYGSTYE